MATTTVSPALEKRRQARHGGDPPNDRFPRGGGEGGDGYIQTYDPYKTVSWVILIPVVMLFVGLTSSLIVRQGISNDWTPLRLPSLLKLNTVILLASSFAFEKARRAMTAASEAFRLWLWITAAAGMLFLLGQVLAWKQLAAQGMFLATNPSSSFFYVLTATHGAHLLGGLTALLYLTIRAIRNELTPRRRSALSATAVFWHFMDGLWIYLLVLLTLWR